MSARRGPARRLGRLVALLLLWLVALEAGSRLYWRITRETPLLQPGAVALSFYPELRHGLAARSDDDVFDVLLLGASVLNYTATPLQELLAAELATKVRVRNTSWPSHSSRDSVLKYDWLGDNRYDLVLFYHGINEVRANNAPPGLFRGDYSHYSWYEDVNALARHPESRVMLLPLTLDTLRIAAQRRLGAAEYVPTHHPKREWVRYGSDIRTAESFRANLTRIVELAREREEKLVLMTFAWFVPDDYSKERFHDGQLSYTPAEKTHPIEIWGSPANVVAGIRAHNAVVREIAAAHPDLPFVDQERRIPGDGAYFGDICHFSERGLEAFVAGIAPIARDARRRAAP